MPTTRKRRIQLSPPPPPKTDEKDAPPSSPTLSAAASPSPSSLSPALKKARQQQKTTTTKEKVADTSASTTSLSVSPSSSPAAAAAAEEESGAPKVGNSRKERRAAAAAKAKMATANVKMDHHDPQRSQSTKVTSPAVARPCFKPCAVIRDRQRQQFDMDVKKGKELRRRQKQARGLTMVYVNERGRQIVPFFRNHSVFSNFYPAVFWVAERQFRCSEQFYHFCKAIAFDDKATAEAIMQTEKPAKQKSLGKFVNGFDRQQWDMVSILAMVIGLMHKFQQNDGLRAELLATEGAELIEASPFDDRWGAGKTANKILDGERWHGKNLLGRILMAVRAHFLADAVNFSIISSKPHHSLPCPAGGSLIPRSPVHELATETELRVAEALANEFVDDI